MQGDEAKTGSSGSERGVLHDVQCSLIVESGWLHTNASVSALLRAARMDVRTRSVSSSKCVISSRRAGGGGGGRRGAGGRHGGGRAGGPGGRDQVYLAC